MRKLGLAVLGIGVVVAFGAPPAFAFTGWEKAGGARTDFDRYKASVPGGGGVGVVISRAESPQACEKRRLPLTITLRNGRNHLRVHTPRMCGGRWRAQGRAPGVRRFLPSFWSDEDEVGTTFLLLTNYQTIRREYRFVLRAPDRVMRGWVTVDHKAADEEQIFEGSDAFVNFCINQGREIRSSGGRLYCVRIIGERGFLKLHPHRW